MRLAMPACVLAALVSVSRVTAQERHEHRVCRTVVSFGPSQILRSGDDTVLAVGHILRVGPRAVAYGASLRSGAKEATGGVVSEVAPRAQILSPRAAAVVRDLLHKWEPVTGTSSLSQQRLVRRTTNHDSTVTYQFATIAEAGELRIHALPRLPRLSQVSVIGRSSWASVAAVSSKKPLALVPWAMDGVEAYVLQLAPGNQWRRVDSLTGVIAWARLLQVQRLALVVWLAQSGPTGEQSMLHARAYDSRGHAMWESTQEVVGGIIRSPTFDEGETASLVRFGVRSDGAGLRERVARVSTTSLELLSQSFLPRGSLEHPISAVSHGRAQVIDVSVDADQLVVRTEDREFRGPKLVSAPYQPVVRLVSTRRDLMVAISGTQSPQGGAQAPLTLIPVRLGCAHSQPQ
jgi:hypothetical protein